MCHRQYLLYRDCGHVRTDAKIPCAAHRKAAADGAVELTAPCWARRAHPERGFLVADYCRPCQKRLGGRRASRERRRLSAQRATRRLRDEQFSYVFQTALYGSLVYAWYKFGQ